MKEGGKDQSTPHGQMQLKLEMSEAGEGEHKSGS